MWQPIETAPKDGTFVILAREGENLGLDPMEISSWVVDSRDKYVLIDGNVFRKEVVEYGYWNGNGHRATHWMPLPEAPNV